jgi:tetratricopeptide (TPR) repeat protein
MRALPLLLILAAAGAPAREAERLAAEALRAAAADPERALEQARRALALTAAFDPTDFVPTGRHGEIVEDAFKAARREYRLHRAGLYEAVGESLARLGRPEPAARYLERAVLLDPADARVLRLARAQLALGRAAPALESLHGLARRRGYAPEALALVEEAVDLLRQPSAQAEIDRARIAALPAGSAAYVAGPVALPAGIRLPTGELLHAEDAPTLIYVSEASCRSCSVDLQALKRTVKAPWRLVLVPEQVDQDRALRQVLALYRYSWPVVSVRDAPRSLRVKPRSLLAIARGGWSAAAIMPPFETTLSPVLDVFARQEVHETVPRPAPPGAASQRAAVPAPAPPALLPQGLAPGEDEPPPEEFVAAVEAFRAGRPAEAMRRFEALEARGDGWLLPPEARFDRALCLAALGRRQEAREMLLRIGDSRFQDAVDSALERVGSGRQSR